VDLKKFKTKSLEELKTDKEKWFYLLKNASLIKEKEANSLKQDPVFQRALERLERLSSDPKTRKAYEASINEHRDYLAVLSSERKAGHVDGLKKDVNKKDSKSPLRCSNVADLLKRLLKTLVFQSKRSKVSKNNHRGTFLVIFATSVGRREA